MLCTAVFHFWRPVSVTSIRAYHAVNTTTPVATFFFVRMYGEDAGPYPLYLQAYPSFGVAAFTPPQGGIVWSRLARSFEACSVAALSTHSIFILLTSSVIWGTRAEALIHSVHAHF